MKRISKPNADVTFTFSLGPTLFADLRYAFVLYLSKIYHPKRLLTSGIPVPSPLLINAIGTILPETNVHDADVDVDVVAKMPC